ncbi:unnamed protein product [Arabidopsis halleri]
MEGKGRVGSSSSSSYTAKIFGPKEPSSSANFNSIFPPPSKSIQGTSRNILSSKHGSLDQRKESATCNLSSSLYYGGQDVYSQSTHNHTHTTVKETKSLTLQNVVSNQINKDQNRDNNDANSSDASRGNWWQGIIYIHPNQMMFVTEFTSLFTILLEASLSASL